MARSFTEKPSAFDDNFQGFLERKISCSLFAFLYRRGVEPNFDKWMKAIARQEWKKDSSTVRELLEELHKEFKILPAAVLLILATTKHLLITAPITTKVNNKEPRRAAIQALEDALKVIATYDAPSLFLCSLGRLLNQSDMEQEWAAKSYLERLKGAIDKLRPKKQSNIEMRFCAQTLGNFFQKVTGGYHYEQVGELMKSAFPHDWGAAGSDGDLRLAAFQRAKGRRINANRSTLEEALDLQNQDAEHQKFWRDKAKEWGLILRSEERAQQKHAMEQRRKKELARNRRLTKQTRPVVNQSLFPGESL